MGKIILESLEFSYIFNDIIEELSENVKQGFINLDEANRVLRNMQSRFHWQITLGEYKLVNPKEYREHEYEFCCILSKIK